ncbi:MAG: DUF421 domain-containing protein [Clostridia bacterium]|nr:DUF421 domain-containing protein [Clostridia bacterium]
MTVILIRTLIVYCMLTAVMRMMGKRQLGELQISELISTLVLSEVAATPIADPNIPLLYALIPVALIFSCELILPELFFHFPRLRKFVEGTPSFLIQNGQICQGELRKNRITIEEFLAALRTGGVSDPTQVDYAILEASGMISIFRHATDEPPTASDLNTSVSDTGIAHIIVSDGKFNHSSIREMGLTEDHIYRYLSPYSRPLSDVFLMTYDDAGNFKLVWKDST